MSDGLTVFTVFEARSTWEEQHPDLARAGYGRFLEDEESIETILQEIRQAGIRVEPWRYSADTMDVLLGRLRAVSKPLLWNLTDGYGYYTGSYLPAFVQLSRIPHVGSGSYTQMLCQNKHHLKAVAHSLGVPSARGTVFQSGARSPLQIPDCIVPPYFVKPAKLDNSIGDHFVSPVCPDQQSALDAVRSLMQIGITDVLVEEYLPGEEFSIIAANGGYWVLECVRIKYGDARYFSSSAKDEDEFSCEFTSGETARQMIRHAMRLADEIRLQDYFRADFRRDSAGTPRFLEVNSGPFLISPAYDYLARKHFGTRSRMFKAVIHQSHRRQSISPIEHLTR